MGDRIEVTKTFLPSLASFHKYLEGIWNRGWVTNNGQLVRGLEDRLQNYLQSDRLYLVNNGTMALQIAARSLNLKGTEVITTPFTYVATLNSLLWEGVKPVMADIDPTNYTIDPEKIREKITNKTSAILAVHVYGYPCDVMAIQQIAIEHDLKIIYDAAQAFGTSSGGKPLSSFGDVICYSFHATKPFHTVEGGGIIANDASLEEKIDLIRHFGHRDADHFMLGINGKMSELHAAMGHLVLDSFEELSLLRKDRWNTYERLLKDQFDEHGLPLKESIEYNYAYYPIRFRNEKDLKIAFKRLAKQGIYARRYFFPSLNQLPQYSGDVCPIAEDISRRVACLPLSHAISDEEIRIVTEAVVGS